MRALISQKVRSFSAFGLIQTFNKRVDKTFDCTDLHPASDLLAPACV